MKPGIFDTDVFMEWMASDSRGSGDSGTITDDDIVSVLETYPVFAEHYMVLGDALREVYSEAVIGELRKGECISDATREGLQAIGLVPRRSAPHAD